jgi:hypothetical protein
MTNLMYNSATDTLMTRDDLKYIPTPPPMGPRHAPYSYAEFANTTVGAIQDNGFNVDLEEYAVTKDGANQFFGLLHVSSSNGPSTGPAPGAWCPTDNLPAVVMPPQNWNLLVALRGSHDQTIARGLAIGSQVIVCSNLCFHGDLGNWHSKQTINLNTRIPGMVADAVRGLGDAGSQLTVDFDGFNNTPLALEQGDSILVDCYRSKAFSSSQLGRALSDWQDSSVPEHTAGGRNLWWLFNAATQALKPTGANHNQNDLRQRSTLVYGKMTGALKSIRDNLLYTPPVIALPQH